jgi:hypothetical protein
MDTIFAIRLQPLTSIDRQLPADECWPSTETWDKLNNTIEGRLIRGKPPASVCYPKEPNYDAKACEQVIASWTSSAWHGNDPVSINEPGLDGCFPIYPNGTSIYGDASAGSKGCKSNDIPAYVVNATSESDVAAGVKFALKHSLRLNVKNTGHGRSSIPGSISIWTHHFRSKTFHHNYTPQGYGGSANVSHMAITLGSGIMDREAFLFAAENNAVVVGGTDSTVGLVGWGGAGGHGYLTGEYGMGADNFLEATVVLPNGKVIVTNEYQNEDVFWAIRGGGAGTWGVITSVTVKAYPMPNTTLWSLTLSAQNGTTAEQWYKEVAHVFADYPRLRSAGLSGYITLSGAPLMMTNAISAFDMSTDAINDVIKPLTTWLDSRNSTVQVTSQVFPFGKWINFYNFFNLTEAVGGGQNKVSASRLLPTKSLMDVNAVAEMLLNAGPGVEKTDVSSITEFQSSVNISANKHLQQTVRSGRSISGTATGSSVAVDNALNPAWRDSIIHFIANEAYPTDVSSEIADAVTSDMSETAYKLRQLAPDSGAYINEVWIH